jgi:hypothetical protein
MRFPESLMARVKIVKHRTFYCVLHREVEQYCSQKIAEVICAVFERDYSDTAENICFGKQTARTVL